MYLSYRKEAGALDLQATIDQSIQQGPEGSARSVMRLLLAYRIEAFPFCEGPEIQRVPNPSPIIHIGTAPLQCRRISTLLPRELQMIEDGIFSSGVGLGRKNRLASWVQYPATNYCDRQVPVRSRNQLHYFLERCASASAMQQSRLPLCPVRVSRKLARRSAVFA